MPNKPLKILFASDFHGQVEHYRQCIALAKYNDSDVVILGGDLFPRQGHQTSSLEIQKQFISLEFKQILNELNRQSRVCLILGNDDWAGSVPLLRELESQKHLHLLHNQPCPLTPDVTLIGYPYVPPTPFRAKDFEKRDRQNDPLPLTPPIACVSRNGMIQEMEVTEIFKMRSSIEEDLNAFPRFAGMDGHILVSHVPPYNTVLDRLYDGQSVGSQAVREYILKTQPLLSLHGHIHEAPKVTGKYYQYLGKTLSINPGQSRDRLHAVLLEMGNHISFHHTLYSELE